MAESSQDNNITQRQADAQITRLIVMVEGITAKVSSIPQIETDIALMKNSYADVCKDVSKLDILINGNGHPGIKADVAELKNSRDKLTEKIASIYSVAGVALFAALTAIVKIIVDWVVRTP